MNTLLAQIKSNIAPVENFFELDYFRDLDDDRRRLAAVLHLPRPYSVSAAGVGKPRTAAGVRVAGHVLTMDRWRVPVTELRPAGAGRGSRCGVRWVSNPRRSRPGLSGLAANLRRGF